MIATLGLLIALTSSNDCATFQKRAAALAKPVTVDAEEGTVEVNATKGDLTYSFTKTLSATPTCGDQVIVLNRPGFNFVRTNSAALAAISKATDALTALDFAKSSAIGLTKMPDQARDVAMQWFLGKKYGYATVTGSRSLKIMTLAEFKSALARAQHESASIH